MYTIDKHYNNLIEIKKSKFISLAYPVETPSQVEEILAGLHKEYKDATHICYAFVLSNPNLEKASDNGEPDGTAGKPILDVIKKNDLTNVLVVVVRYFGGIKLGAGGLVRAYSSSASEVIKMCRFGTSIEMTEYTLISAIQNAKNLLDLAKKYNIKISGQSYSDVFNLNIFSENINFLNNVNYKVEVVENQKRKVFYDKNQ